LPYRSRLSVLRGRGIRKDMARMWNQRWCLCATLALASLAGGCGWRDLHHDELFGLPDAEMPDAGGGSDADAPSDAVPELAVDLAMVDAADVADLPDASGLSDAQPDQATVDAESDADVSPACTPTSCQAGQFCDDLTQRCQPNSGTGRLSGVVFDVCDHKAVRAKVGIAGQHQCAVDQKGSYYFQADLPLGSLTLAAYAEGYKLFSTPVVITAAGTNQDIAMERDTPLACDGPPPPTDPCTCTISGCPGVP
jgi:hypothetical protein